MTEADKPGELARALAMTMGMAWRAHRRAFFGLTVCAVLSGVAPVASAWLLRAILDDLAGGQDHPHLLGLAAALGIAGGATVVLARVSQYLSAQSGRAVQWEATATLFTAVTDLPGMQRIEDPEFQDTLRFAQQAGTSGPGIVLAGIITLIQSAITMAGFLITLTLVSPVLAIVLTGSAFPAVALQLGAARREAAMLRGATHAQRRQFFYAGLLTSVTAAKEIRLFGLGAFFRGRMLGELSDVQRSSTRADRRTLLANLAFGAIGTVISAAGVVWAVSATSSGGLTLGDVSVLIAALAAGNGTLGAMVSTGAMTYQTLLMFKSYRKVLAVPADLAIVANPVSVRGLSHGIQIENVWFRYGQDMPWVLRGVSCCIPHGNAVALVGHNGAGKSTLVKLLCRFYDPDHGRILWDGIDLRDMDPGALRDRISAVFQDFMTYELSAADNIAVGDLGRASDQNALHAAARIANVHEFLTELPKGYQTQLTRTFFDLSDKKNPETGVLLSGGQCQRVALARAFLRGGRDLMIMDEPSAGLDAQAEHDLHQQMSLSRRDRTTVLVSHRLNTIRDADEILVLSGGTISERGNHGSLMTRGGTYARLFSLQARGYADDRVTAGAAHD